MQLQDRSYQILTGSGILPQSGALAHQVVELSHAVVITDTNVADYAARVADSLQQMNVRVDTLCVPAGEKTKSIESCNSLWQDMLKCKSDRKSVVFAVGGGVIGDLAGFIAASFARGLRFIQVPTTLLAHVDSSVGGKVGVNLPGAKNMVGAFWQPRLVVIDIDTLNTLPDREYRAGLAEVVKYGVILDETFFSYLEEHVDQINQRDAATLEAIVARCCRLKADVVEQDEHELTGLRAVLNYGHTFCHAIEAVTQYGEFLHGEAVAIGMICASRLAESMGRITADDTRRQHELLTQLGLSVTMPDLDRDKLLTAMQRDKKVEHGRLRFVLPSCIGAVELVGDVDPQLVRAAFDGDRGPA